MDYEIGKMICYKDKILRVEKANKIECEGCFFYDSNFKAVCSCANNTLKCVGISRKDKTNIIFALM
jgi:hypothetical protein